MARIIASGLLFVALLAFTLFAFTQQRAKRIAAQPGWALTAIEDVDIPPATAAQARGILARRPLNQPVLNLLFAVESRGDLDPARRETFIDTIKALGWRDTPSQQNLIVETLRDGDPREAVMRADALLRRGKLASNIIAVLAQIEIYPQAADLLIERLDKQPTWRKRYFSYSGTLSNPALLDARIQLLDKMLAKGMTLSRSDLKASLDAMVRAGRQGEAVRIAMAANPSGSAGTSIYDPDFSRFAALTSRDRDNVLPFEWSLASRPGISVMIVPRSDAGQLQVRWNGMGAPVIAHTMTMLREGAQPRLEIRVDGVDALNGLGSFGFSLACRGKGAVAFEQSRAPSKDNVVGFTASGPVMCDYPEFTILGRPQAADREAETAIDSIRLSTS